MKLKGYKFSLSVSNNEIFLITSDKKIIKTSTKIQRTLKKISKLIKIKKIKLIKPSNKTKEMVYK